MQAAERAPRADPDVLADAFYGLDTVDRERGDYETAARSCERALALRTAVLGRADARVGTARAGLPAVRARQGPVRARARSSKACSVPTTPT